MKKFLAAGFLALLITGCAYAAETQDKGYISVNVEATEELDPTLVKISFAIETKEKNADTAANLNKEASTKAIGAVKALVDTTKGESIKTTSYYLTPEYIYKDGKRNLTGYMASNTLQVTLKDVSKAGKIISTALANGANSANNLQFILEETNDNCNLLIQKASKGAKERADKIAQSMNTTVTGIKSITAGCSSSSSFNASNYRLLNAKAEAAMDSAGASVPVESGKTQLRAYVNADFFVK